MTIRTARPCLRGLSGLLLLWLVLSGPVQALDLTPSDTTYTLSRGFLPLGEARFRLYPYGEPDCWRYEYQARPSGLARLFIGNVTERSEFCIVDGQLQSQYFEFRRADKSADNYTLHFNWAEKVVRSSKGELRQLEPGMVDRLAQQIQVQHWVIQRKGEPGEAQILSTKVEDDRVRSYRFRITGRERIEVPAGRFDAVRVERVDDPRKSTRFWLLPEQNYLAAQVEQVKEGSEQLSIKLQSINPPPDPSSP